MISPTDTADGAECVGRPDPLQKHLLHPQYAQLVLLAPMGAAGHCPSPGPWGLLYLQFLTGIPKESLPWDWLHCTRHGLRSAGGLHTYPPAPLSSSHLLHSRQRPWSGWKSSKLDRSLKISAGLHPGKVWPCCTQIPASSRCQDAAISKPTSKSSWGLACECSHTAHPLCFMSDVLQHKCCYIKPHI